MGFFDSFNKSFNEEKDANAKRRENSRYQTVKQRKSDVEANFAAQSDGTLLNKMSSAFTSAEDKSVIDGILRGRGYKNINGSYRRL